jgi:hypothetical protein
MASKFANLPSRSNFLIDFIASEIPSLRVRIEHVFDRRMAFRVLRGAFPFHPNRLATVFAAVAFVHNAILDENERRVES